MFPGAKIIAVDDNEEELAAIVSSLRQLGLACLSYNYPEDLPEEAPNATGLRLIFMDINLLGGASPDQDANVFNAPISLLDRLISTSNGPYALITWSSTELHERLIERIQQTNALNGKRPFFHQPLSKADYLGDIEGLKEAIKRILTDNPAFGALLDWERRLSRAGEAVLQDIYTFSASFQGALPVEKLDRMLSKLAVDAFGKVHVEQHRFEAVNEALLPILGDALSVHFLAEDGREIWERAVTKHNERIALEPAVIARLNSAVIFEGSATVMPHRRGAVLRLPDSWLTDDAFVTRFGVKSKQVRGELLKLNQPANPLWVLVQTQAACDFAQPRLGPIPYLLGAIIPDDCERKKGSDGKDLPLPSSVWVSPSLAHIEGAGDGNCHFAIIHSMGCYLTREVASAQGFTVLGRLKDQIIGPIAFEHHSHGSRPGFVSFR